MSIKVIGAVLRLGPAAVTPAERLVLYALAWHADDRGLNAWPAVSTLARETSLTRRTVQRVLRHLNAKGFVVVQALAARGSVRYAVHLEVLDRERYAQSGADCDTGSQSGSTATVGQGGASQDRPTATLCRPSATQDRPIRPLTVLEPSVKGAAAPRGPAAKKSHDGPPADDRAEDDAEALTRLAHETFDALGDDAPFPALVAAFTGRLNGRKADAVLDNIGAFLFSVKKQRRQLKAGWR